jgi:hypothetical protein
MASWVIAIIKIKSLLSIVGLSISGGASYKIMEIMQAGIQESGRNWG